MRNPARKALYCLAAVLLGAALIRFGIFRFERSGEGWTSTGPMALGLAIIPFPLLTLVQALFAMRGQARLLAGIGVIARWHVSPADWDRFRGIGDRRSGEDFSLGNDLWVRRSTPRTGVEVIVGEKGALVDNSYHSLNPRGLPELRGVRWLSGAVDCLEFALLYPRSRYGGTVPMTLRVPVPAEARGAGQLVFAHYEQRCRRTPGLALRNPSRTYRVCAALVAAAAVAAAVGWTISEWDNPLVPLGLLIGGTILTAFAIILALATFLITRFDNR